MSTTDEATVGDGLQVTEGDGDAVGGVVGLGRRVQRQEPLHHLLHLPLFGVAVAADGLLDLGGRVLGEGQAVERGGEQHHAARLPHRDGVGDVLAEEELLEAGRYIKADDVGQGKRFEKAFEEALEWARSEPLIFRCFENDFRKLKVGKFRYLLIFPVRGDEVQVLAVAHTSRKPGFAAGIATVEIDGIEPNRLAGWLFDTHRIIVTPITHPQFRGIRVSPSVYSTLEEVARFVAAMETVVRRGLPSA